MRVLFTLLAACVCVAMMAVAEDIYFEGKNPVAIPLTGVTSYAAQCSVSSDGSTMTIRLAPGATTDAYCQLPAAALSMLPAANSLFGYALRFNVSFTGMLPTFGRHGGVAIGRSGHTRQSVDADIDWIERSADYGLRVFASDRSASSTEMLVNPPLGHDTHATLPPRWTLSFSAAYNGMFSIFADYGHTALYVNPLYTYTHNVFLLTTDAARNQPNIGFWLKAPTPPLTPAYPWAMTITGLTLYSL